jgi:HK97 family phage portal protein
VGIFLGQEKRSWIPEPVVPPVRGTDIYGNVSVSTKPDQALTLAPVWSAVGLLANTISSLPLQSYRDGPDNVPLKIKNPPLVANPGVGMLQSQWIHAVMVSLLLRGNAYGKITMRDAQMRPTQMLLMNPDMIDVVEDDDGKLTYKVRRTQRILPSEDVWHLPGMTMPGSKIGLSPISYAAQTMGLTLGARQFASDFFNGGGIPKAVLETDQPVNQDQARTIKDRLLGSFRAREPIVLGAGVKYTQISVAPEESQFLETQKLTATDIARFFWVPADMIDAPSGGSMTYANREQRSLDFLVYSVAHWLKRIEDSLFGLLPSPQYVKFDVRELLRTDAETQATVYLQYLAAKVYAPSEVRQKLGEPPMTDAQKTEADLVPMSVGVTGKPKALPALKMPPGAEAPVPTDDVSGGQGG